MRMGRTGCRWGGSAAHPPPHIPPTPPGGEEPRVIQQQENQTKNNLLVLMGLVLSLPRTFQPSSRDGSGERGSNKAKSFPVSRRQGSARCRWPERPIRSRHCAACLRPPPSDINFPFPGLHYFLERGPRALGREGLSLPSVFILSAVCSSAR